MNTTSLNTRTIKIPTPQATRESSSRQTALQNLTNFLDRPLHSSPSSTKDNIDERNNLIKDVDNLNLTPEQATNILNKKASDEQCRIVIEVLIKLRGTNEANTIQTLLQQTKSNDESNYGFRASTSTLRNHSPDVKIEELEESEPIKRIQRSPVCEKNTPQSQAAFSKKTMNRKSKTSSPKDDLNEEQKKLIHQKLQSYLVTRQNNFNGSGFNLEYSLKTGRRIRA